MRAGWAASDRYSGPPRPEDSIKTEVLNDISPVPGAVGFGTVLRSLSTPFLDEWSGKREEARRDRDRLRGEILATHQAGRPHDTLLTAGQTAGGIKEILPVAEIMRLWRPKPKRPWRGPMTFAETDAHAARCTGTPIRSFLRP